MPDHSQFSPDENNQRKSILLSGQLALLGRFLRSDSVFLELGAGDCAVSLAVSEQVAKVYAVDVSRQIEQGGNTPNNFQLVLSDGCLVPLEDSSVDIAYSHQLMEHIHPDDALAQLKEVFRVLRDGGVYVCVTPNRLSGPHDISKYFAEVANGLHLKEYTVDELDGLLGKVGFGKRYWYLKIKNVYLKLPRWLVRAVEAGLGLLPLKLSRRVGRFRPVRGLLGIRMATFK